MTTEALRVPAHPAATAAPSTATGAEWWRSAVIYEVYVRSFADADGDGTGDLAGVRSKLDYLEQLGIDALWFTPWYPSPLADGGYDVSDYRAINPAFGDLAEAEALIREAFARGIRTIIDIVPNHVSHEHPWFQAALAAAPGSRARERFWFRDGRGENGELPPTDWVSNFGGPTWTRTTNPDGTPGQWYLHLFSPQQPDLNWNHPDIRREHEDILRFWFDRGVAGVRIDSAALLVKDPTLPEVPENPGPGEHPNTDRDELHEIYRSWRAVADEYADTPEGPRVLVGEIWLPDAARFAKYLRPDEMHTAFNFDFMSRAWDADELRASVTTMLAAHAPVGAPSTWVLSNHDVTRPVTRYGRSDSTFAFAAKRFGTPTDRALGTRRARAAALLTAALPGSLYLYQGDELGLPEAEDIPLELLHDPMHARSGGVDPGRDGCRVPLPWSGDRPPYGFSAPGTSPDAGVPVADATQTGDATPTGHATPTDGATRADGMGRGADATPGGGATAAAEDAARTWLPQPGDWASLSVAAQVSDPHSMLALYRAALRIRRSEPTLGDGEFRWLDSDPQVLAFARGGAEGVVSVTNFGPAPVALPPHREVLLTSTPLEGGLLSSDSTAWLRPAP